MSSENANLGKILWPSVTPHHLQLTLFLCSLHSQTVKCCLLLSAPSHRPCTLCSMNSSKNPASVSSNTQAVKPMNSSCPHLVAIHSVNCSIFFKWSLYLIQSKSTARHWLGIQWLLWVFLMFFISLLSFTFLWPHPWTLAVIRTQYLAPFTDFLIQWHHPLLLSYAFPTCKLSPLCQSMGTLHLLVGHFYQVPQSISDLTWSNSNSDFIPNKLCALLISVSNIHLFKPEILIICGSEAESSIT